MKNWPLVSVLSIKAREKKVYLREERKVVIRTHRKGERRSQVRGECPWRHSSEKYRRGMVGTRGEKRWRNWQVPDAL